MRFRIENIWARKANADVDRLISETEAFLAGDALRLQQSEADVAPWVWLNAFAHGSLRKIRRIRYGRKQRAANFEHLAREVLFTTRNDSQALRLLPTDEQRWHNAQRLLAKELLQLVDNDEGLLSYVQSHVLIPLELELLTGGDRQGLDPLELLRRTRAALHEVSP